MSKNLKTQWRVQVRKSRAHKWVNKGLFETRRNARNLAYVHRMFTVVSRTATLVVCGYGFGNTRVIKYVKGAK